MEGGQYGFKCPQSTTLEEVKNKIPAYQWSYQQSGQFAGVRILQTNSFLLRFDVGDSIWAMCVKDMFTIDIDVKDGMTKEDAVFNVYKYTEFMHSQGIDLLFRIYETDRGLHAHLISERVSAGTEAAMQMSIDLCTDIHYIIFNIVSGFCARVAPKLKKQRKDPVTGKDVIGKDPKTQAEIEQEFVANKCYIMPNARGGLEPGEKCTIGYGTADPYLEGVLYVYEKLIQYFKSAYLNDLENLRSFKTVQWNSVTYRGTAMPNADFLQATRAYTQQLLNEVGMTYPRGEWTIPVPYSKNNWLTEYKPFVDPATLYTCSTATPYEIQRKATSIVLDKWESECAAGKITVGGYNIPDDRNPILTIKGLSPSKIVTNPSDKAYPFVCGIDSNIQFIFITFSNLIMMDWDVKDGFPKNTPLNITKRYLDVERTLNSEMKIRPDPMKFKFYETDNGVHGFCVSHHMSYNEQPTPPIFKLGRSLELMRRMCVDPWYIAFCKSRGYAIRVGPKMGARPRNKEKFVQSSKEEIQRQFVQKLGVEVSGYADRVVYFGEGLIDPYLDSLTNMIFELQQRTLRIPNLAARLNADQDSVAIEVGEMAKNLYDSWCRPLEKGITDVQMKSMYAWADTSFRCPIPTDIIRRRTTRGPVKASASVSGPVKATASISGPVKAVVTDRPIRKLIPPPPSSVDRPVPKLNPQNKGL